jgi:hypothetical protein
VNTIPRTNLPVHSLFLVAFVSIDLSSSLLLIILITIGEAVTVEDEIVVVNSIVLPHKTLNVSVQEEIIL